MIIRNVPSSISSLNQKLRDRGSKLPDHVFMNLLGSADYQDKLRMTTADDVGISDDEIDLAIQEAGSQQFNAEVLQDETDGSAIKATTTAPGTSADIVVDQPTTPGGMITDQSLDTPEDAEIDIQPQEGVAVKEPYQFNFDVESNPELYQQFQISLAQDFSNALNGSMIQDGTTTVVTESKPIFENIGDDNTTFLRSERMFPVFDEEGEFIADDYFYNTFTITESIDGSSFDGEIEGLPYITLDGGYEELTQGGVSTKHIAIGIDYRAKGDRALMEIASLLGRDSSLELLDTEELENKKKKFLESQGKRSEYAKTVGQMSAVEEIQYYLDEFRKINAEDPEKGRVFLENVMNNTWIKDAEGMFLYKEIQPGTSTTISDDKLNPVLAEQLESSGVLGKSINGSRLILPLDEFVSSLNLTGVPEGIIPFGIPLNIQGITYDHVDLDFYDQTLKEFNGDTYVSLRTDQVTELGNYGIQFLTNTDERVLEMSHVLEKNGYVLVSPQRLQALKDSDAFVAQRAYEFISNNYDLESGKLNGMQGYEMLYLSPMLFESKSSSRQDAQRIEREIGVEITAGTSKFPPVRSFTIISAADAANMSTEETWYVQSKFSEQKQQIKEAIRMFAETGELVSPEGVKDVPIPSGYRLVDGRKEATYKNVPFAEGVTYYLNQMDPGASKPSQFDVADLQKMLTQNLQIVSLYNTDENGDVSLVSRSNSNGDYVVSNFSAEQNIEFWEKGWLPTDRAQFKNHWDAHYGRAARSEYDASIDDGTEGTTYWDQVFDPYNVDNALYDYTGSWYFPDESLLGQDVDITLGMNDARLKYMNLDPAGTNPYARKVLSTTYEDDQYSVQEEDVIGAVSFGFLEDAYYNQKGVSNLNWDFLIDPMYRPATEAEKKQYKNLFGREMHPSKIEARPAGYEAYISNQPGMLMTPDGSEVFTKDLETRTIIVRGKEYEIGATGADMMSTFMLYKELYPNPNDRAKAWYETFFKDLDNSMMPPSAFVPYEKMNDTKVLQAWYIQNGYMNDSRSVATFRQAPGYQRYPLLAEFQPGYLGRMLTAYDGTAVAAKKDPILIELDLMEANLEAGVLADIMEKLRADPKLVEERKLAEASFNAVYGRIIDLQTLDEPRYKQHFKRELDHSCRVKAAGVGSCYIVRMENGLEKAMNYDEFYMWKKSKGFKYDEADVRMFTLEGAQSYGIVRWGQARLSNLTNGLINTVLSPFGGMSPSVNNQIEVSSFDQQRFNEEVWGQKSSTPISYETIEIDYDGETILAMEKDGQLIGFSSVDGRPMEDVSGDYGIAYKEQQLNAIRASNYNSRALISQTTDVVGDLVILISLTAASSGGGLLAGGAEGAMALSRLVSFVTTTAQTQTGQYNSAINSGASREDARSYGLWSSMSIGAINLFTPGIEKTLLTKLDDAVLQGTADETTRRAILSSLNKYKNSLSLDDFIAFGKEWAKAGLNESFQEVVLEGMSDEINQTLILPESVDKAMFKTSEEAVVEGLISFIISGPVALTSIETNPYQVGYLQYLATTPKSSIEKAKKMMEKGDITKEQLETFTELVTITSNSLKQIKALAANNKIDGVFESVYEYQEALYKNEQAPEGKPVFSEDQLKDLKSKYEAKIKETEEYAESQESDIITDDQFLDIYMSGKVTRDVVDHVSLKLYRNQELTAREQYLYNLYKEGFDKNVGNLAILEKVGIPVESKVNQDPLAPVSEEMQKSLDAYKDMLFSARKASTDPENSSDQDKENLEMMQKAGVDITNPEYSMAITGVQFESLFDNDAIELDQETDLIADLDVKNPTDAIQGGEYVVVYKNTLKFDPLFKNNINTSVSHSKATISGSIRLDDVQTIYKRNGNTLTLVYSTGGFTAKDGAIESPVTGRDIQNNTDQTATDVSQEFGLETEVIENPTLGDLTIDPGTISDVFVLDMSTADLQQAINNGNIPDGAVFRMFNGKIAKGTRYIVVGKGTAKFVPFDEGKDQAGYFESSGSARAKNSNMSNYDIYRVNEDGSVSKVDYDAIRTKATEKITSDRIVEGLNESGMENVSELEELINNGQWGALTAENPNNETATLQENTEYNRRAKEWLKSRGYETIIDIQGQYDGKPEHSFLVPGLSRQDAIDFAEEFSQESVATNEGLIYNDGRVETRVDSPVVTKNYGDFQDNFSTIRIGGANVSFAANYQFGVKQNISEWNGERVSPSEVFVPDDAKQNSPASVDILTGIGTFANSPIVTMPGSAVVKTDEGTKIVMRDMGEGVSELMSIYTPRSKRGQGNAASAVQAIVEGAEGSGNIVMTRLAAKNSFLEGTLLDNGFVKEGNIYVYTPTTYVAPVASRPDSRSNLKVTGNEEVVNSDVTIGTAVRSNGTTITITEGDYFSSSEPFRQGAASKVVTTSINLMSGEFNYTNKNGESFTIKLPFSDKKLAARIKSLRTRYKNATSKDQKAKLKLKLQEATEQAYNQVVDHAEAMLQAHLDVASPEFIEKGRQWYDGANRIAQGLASEYGVTLETASGMIAALSPQNPWDNNIANAESLLSVLTLGSDIVIDADVIAELESLRYTDPKTKKVNANVDSVLNSIENFEGKTLAQLMDEGIESTILAVFARGIFQAEMHAEAKEAGVSLSEYLRYPQYRADGSFSEMSTSRESARSYGDMAKAIEIFLLTDDSKITSLLGNGNKVRNFYNNIVSPNSSEGFITVDTHAAGVAIGVPMGSQAVSGLGVFDAGPNYIYSAIAEAYRNVASRNGMLPRELQSVLWTMAQHGIHEDNSKYEKYRETITEIFSGEGTIADKARAFVETIEFVEPRWLDGTGVPLTTLPKVRPTNESDANQATSGESDSRVDGDMGVSEPSTADVVVQPPEQVKPAENDTKNKIQPGSNLYGQSVPAVDNIKNQYHKNKFGESAPEYTGEQTLNESEQRDIGQAFDEMENAYDDPEVVAAYELWAEETLAQYQAMIDAGYQIVIDHDSPYANAQELLEDVRNNRRLKIYSTESGFGDGITDEMRAKDIRLRPSGFFDKNGRQLLINDVFRGVHDFFGHAVLGNNFSALGEEVAFQVHSRMYSEGAIGPLVTEARAQNAWINFYSEQTQEFYELEAEQKRLQEEGRLDEARLLDSRIQEIVIYPTQKFNILPKRFWNVDRSNTGAFERTGRVQQQAVEQQDVNFKWKRLGLGDFDGDPRMSGKPQSMPGNSPQVSARAMDVLVNRLMESGLATNVTTDKASWEKAINDHFSKKERGRMAKLPDGTIYGFINNSGEVFLNPEVVRASTPIHEFGHLWAIALKNSDPEAYQAALDVMKNTPYHKAVKADPLYSDLAETDPNSTEILEEALANAIADHGEQLIKEGAKQEFGEIEEDISEAVYEKLEDVFGSPQFEMLLGTELASLDSSPSAESVAKKAAAEILGGKQETKNQEVPKSPEEQAETQPPAEPPTEPTEEPAQEGPEATYRTLERALAMAEQEGNEELAEEYRKAVNEGRPIVATEKVVEMRDKAMDQLKKSPDFDGSVERILFEINQTTQQELIDNPHLSSYQAALLDAIASYYEDMGKTKKAVEVRTAQARISSNAGRTLQAFGNTQVTHLPTLDKMKSDNKANKKAYGQKMEGNEEAVNEAMAEAAPTQPEVQDAANSDNVNKAVERAYKKARKATDRSRRTNEQRYNSAIKSAKKNAAKVDGDPTQSDKFMGNVRSAVQAAFNMEAESKSGNLQQNLDNIAEELNIPNSVVNEIANETAKQKVARGASLPEVKAAINDIIYNHYFDRQGDSRSIADKIVDAIPGISNAEANAIANALTQEIVVAIEQRVRKAHERMLDISGTRKKKKPLNVSDNKKYGKLILALAQGGFSNQTVVDNSDIAPALAEYFGIEVLNDNEIAKLETMIYEYMNLDEGERKQRRLRDINNYIQNIKTSSLAHVLSGLMTDIMYANALSGFSTMERATLGGLQTSLMQVVFDAITRGIGSGLEMTLDREGPMVGVVAAGVVDQARGYLDALISLIPNLHELALQRKLGGFISTMLDGYSPLEFADGRDPGVESLLDNIINNNTDLRNADNKVKEALKLFLRIHMFPAVHASRFLPAIDGVLRDQIMSYAERQQVVEYLVKRGYNTFSIEMYKALNDIRGKRDMEEIYERVDEEIDDMIEKGEKVPFGYRERRAEELRKQRTQERLENDDLIQQQKDFAATSLLMGDPEGLLGRGYDIATNFLTLKESDPVVGRLIKMGLRTIFLFLRVPTNFINMTLDYTPYGIYRGIRGDTRVKGGDRRMYTETERARRVIQGMAGISTGIALFARAFDYDDEGNLIPNPDFEVFGEKPDNLRWSDKRNMGRKYSEMSIKMGDQYYSYVDNPMGIWLAPIAYMQDDLRSGEEIEYSPEGVMQYYTQGFGKFGFSQSYSQGINDIIRIVESVGDQEAMLEIAQKRGESSLDLLTVSNLRKQTVKIWNDLMENPEKTDLNFIQKRLSNYPMLMAVTAPEKVDQFGNPVDVDFETGYFLGEFVDAIDEYMTVVETKEYREWALLEKFPDVFVGYRNTTMWKEEELDQEQESFLRRETAFAFGDLVRENIDRLEQIEESEDLDRELKELFSEAKEVANINFEEAYPEFTYEALVNYEGWDPFGGIDFDEAQQYYSVLKSFDGGMERFRERYYEPLTMKGYEFTVAESETIKGYASIRFGENILQAKDMLEDDNISIGAKNDIIDKYWSVSIKQAKSDWVSENADKFGEGVQEAAQEEAERYQQY